MDIASDEEDSQIEERMALIVGPRAEHDELNRRKELRKRLGRKAVRYRRWIMQTTMDKLHSVANPLNDGQEPTELLPNQDVEPKQLKQNGVSHEFRRVVQEETEQFMLQSSSQQAAVTETQWYLRLVDEIPVPFSWRENVLQWRSTIDNVDRIIVDDTNNDCPVPAKILKRSDSMMENMEEIRAQTPPKSSKTSRKKSQGRRSSLRLLARKNGDNEVELITLI
ncbi:unnamed protein product [Meloidogyne enterolobii]|uniref:Uncharacterized protein n=1 Tax=Meloidogyne enterolobii TaxID=390850 RepID=A0ACB0XVK6_MELEN